MTEEFFVAESTRLSQEYASLRPELQRLQSESDRISNHMALLRELWREENPGVPFPKIPG